jgi:outer membrane biogenesis lipoprotein LolB
MLGKRIRAAVFMLIVAACLSGCSADAFNPALHPARTPYQTQQTDGQDIPAP